MLAQQSRLHLRVQDAVYKFQSYILRQYSSDAPNWSLAKRRIQDVAESIISSLDLNQPPIDLDQITELFDIKVTRTPMLYKNVSGQLIPRRSGFEIKIAAGRTHHLSTRWRFSLAHELGHTLFFSLGPHGPERIFPKQIDAFSEISKREERLCDSFAAALLVPTLCLEYFQNRSPRLAEIIQASIKFQVTPDVVLRRLLYDCGYLDDKAVYVVRFTPELLVYVFRGRCQANRTLPTEEHLKSILVTHDRRDYVRVLTEQKVFSKPEFCVYGGRTLYVLV